MFKPGDTPVPGYSLLGLLGRGQYGEVWEATGPGGTRLAIKFISLAENKGRIELKSIQAVKLIRHANLIPINAIWLLDREGKVVGDDEAARAMALSQQSRTKNQTLVSGDLDSIQQLGYLVICMAKADGSLEQRLERSIEAGNSGIDPNELARYMREAASGLDFLNSPQHLVNGELVGIQHRDIKPANLLLMGDTVVVGDFGVSTTVREFDAMMTAVVGSLAFMAPESLSQKTSPTSDQYALAITYYQLRCGQLPYDGTAPLDEIISIHKEGLLEFESVSEAERRVLRRATAIDPHDRYESCREFAEAISDSLRPAQPPSQTVVKTSFPVVPVGGAMAALLAIVAFLIIDPAGWFAPKPDPPPAPTPRAVVLTFVPGEISGSIEIAHADSTQPTETVPISAFANLQLLPDDLVTIKSETDNPFVGNVDKVFTTSQLEEMEWRIELPKIPPEEILASVDRMLDENRISDATALYSRAAKFDESFRSVPRAVELDLEMVTRFSVDSESGAIAVSTRTTTGDAAAIIRFDNGKLVSTKAPVGTDAKNLIESFGFRDSGRELFIVRQRSIQRWMPESSSIQTLPDSENIESTSRWMFGRISPDSKWLAAADTQGTMRLWNLSESNPGASPFSHVFDDRIVNLIFDNTSQRLNIVTGSVPISQVELSSGPTASLTVGESKVQPDLDGQVIVQAIPVSNDALVIGTEDGLIIGQNFLTANSGSFGNHQAIAGGSVSRLIGLRSCNRFVVETESEPSALVLDTANTEPLATVGTETAHSIRESAISGDGQWTAIAPDDGSLGLIDLRTEKSNWIPFQKMSGQNFKFVAFSQDGKHLVAVSTTTTSPSTSRLHLWNFPHCWLSLDSNATEISGRKMEARK